MSSAGRARSGVRLRGCDALCTVSAAAVAASIIVAAAHDEKNAKPVPKLKRQKWKLLLPVPVLLGLVAEAESAASCRQLCCRMLCCYLL